MKIFVTGLHGDIGMVLGPMLLKYGHNVSGLDRNLLVPGSKQVITKKFHVLLKI